LKQYLSVFRIKFINNLQYRAAALAGIFTQVFFGLVFIMVYIAFYESNTGASTPMQLSQLISYLWLNQIFFVIVYIWIKDEELLSMIKNGNVAYELCRPVNFYFKWYFTIYGTRLSSLLLRFLPVLVMALLLPSPYNLSLPASWLSLLLFIVSIFIASLLVTAISMIFHIITFFTLDERGVLTLLMVIGEIFEGGVIPIVFFPKFLQVIAYMLPFRYICDIPFRIYSGNINIAGSLINIGLSIAWLILCFGIGIILSKRALKKAVIQGG